MSKLVINVLIYMVFYNMILCMYDNCREWTSRGKVGPPEVRSDRLRFGIGDDDEILIDH